MSGFRLMKRRLQSTASGPAVRGCARSKPGLIWLICLEGKEEVIFAKLKAEAEAAMAEDGADVIVLGSTSMHQSAHWLAEEPADPGDQPRSGCLQTGGVAGPAWAFTEQKSLPCTAGGQ